LASLAPLISEPGQLLASVNFEVLFAKKFCDFLRSLEMYIPVSAKRWCASCQGRIQVMKIRGERVSQEQKQEECYHKEVGRNCLMDGLIFSGRRV
jgi:hypothetical protein